MQVLKTYIPLTHMISWANIFQKKQEQDLQMTGGREQNIFF